MEVPVEYEEEELQQREVVQDVTEEVKVPQVRANYAYKGQGMQLEKGEVRTKYVLTFLSIPDTPYFNLPMLLFYYCTASFSRC